MTMLLFWVLTPCRLVDTNVSEKHTVSIFKDEVTIYEFYWSHNVNDGAIY
jgi:hypothetical protein